MSSTPAPASRNSPCPCGSGKRYRDCHGSLSRTAGTPAGAATRDIAAPRRSSYRAPGSEWEYLSEEVRDQLGASMERALMLQRAERFDDAAELYVQVLQKAPRTHDALHMLGVIELRRDNAGEAERLIKAAMELRKIYPALEHNWKLAQDAVRARLHARSEEVCELVLPLLADLALAPPVHDGAEHQSAPPRFTGGSARSRVHLIGRTNATEDDDGWLFSQIAVMSDRGTTMVWTTDRGSARNLADLRTHEIDADIGAYPRGGIHVFVGINLERTSWLARAEAERIVVFCINAPPTLYVDNLRAIARDGARRIELVFPSHAAASRFGPGHSTWLPPIETSTRATFDVPNLDLPDGVWTIRPPAVWPVGIAGRGRHVETDFGSDVFAKTLLRCSDALRIYDPGRLRYVFGGNPRARFFPRGAGRLPRFLDGLRCFVQRPLPWWQEGSARELFAALAMGIPVLVPESSNYAEYVEDGVDGCLYRSLDELQTRLYELHAASAWAAQIGSAGRDKALRLMDPERCARSLRALIDPRAAAHPDVADKTFSSARGVIH